jgi:hypothetical protein
MEIFNYVHKLNCRDNRLILRLGASVLHEVSFGDGVTGDLPSDIMFVHSGIFSFSTAIHIPKLFGILLSIPPTYQVCVQNI